MNYETYQTITGKKYYVPETARQLDKFIVELAREKKLSTSTRIFEIVDVWIKGEDLYLEKIPGAKKKVAVTRRG